MDSQQHKWHVSQQKW